VSRNSSNPASGRRSARRRLAKPVVASVAAGLATMASVGAFVASAAVPAFPDNVVVFPDRDFVSLEGFQNHVGETATVEVSRGATVIGSAQGKVAAGDVAFEVNHPGGVCWGNGTNLNVTPDIKPGDVVSIKFPDDSSAETTVGDAFVDADAVQDGTTVTVQGHIAPGVNRAQLEQRIVEPALTDTVIGRRDVRALPGPIVASDKGGYSSGLDFIGTDRFKATYIFDSPDVAEIAANAELGERILSWQEEDADGNRQGLTIAEFGEAGGPGMGGCPAGPGDQAAPKPGTAAVARSGETMTVKWEPATAQPGADPVTGYSVEAIAKTTSTSGEQVQIGRRTGPNATSTTITGLAAGESYDVEVRSLAGPRMSEAFTVEAAGAPAPGTGDTTVPTLNADPAPDANGGTVETKTVTLAGTDPEAAKVDIYYTTDGSPAITGDLPSDGAKLYTGPIAITQPTQLRAVVFDAAGNHTELSGDYAPPTAADPPPAAPTGLTATAGQESVTLRWTADDPAIDNYRVTVHGPAGDPADGRVEKSTARNLTVSGLTAGTTYSFTVAASNDGGTTYGAESTSASATPTKVTDRVTIGTAKWKSGDFRVTGTASVVGATVTIRAGSPTGQSLGQAAVTAAAPPATGGEYDLRLRNGAAPATNPGTIYAVSSGGGVAGPFTVARG
jgi:hypothetical protein